MWTLNNVDCSDRTNSYFLFFFTRSTAIVKRELLMRVRVEDEHIRVSSTLTPVGVLHLHLQKDLDENIVLEKFDTKK